MQFSQVYISTKATVYQHMFSVFLLALSFQSYSQTNGYKKVELGDKLYNDSITKYYEIRQIAANGFRLNSHLSETFCDIKIDHIDIKINQDSTVNLMQVHTCEVIYKDNADFLDKYKQVAQCIVNTVGEASYVDPGTDREDGQITLGWKFEKEKSLLMFFGNSIAIDEKNVKREFLIVWGQSNGPQKMW